MSKQKTLAWYAKEELTWRAQNELLFKERNEARRRAEDAEKARNEAQLGFFDLKRRLHNALLCNERMRGYLNRVHEDDQVREELITTGEPEGEMRLVPKRKFTEFPEPENAYSDTMSKSEQFNMGYSERQQQRKHWLAY